MTRYLDNDAANAVESNRRRQEREQLERIGTDLAQARAACDAQPNSKRLQERVRKLNAAMNALQRL